MACVAFFFRRYVYLTREQMKRLEYSYEYIAISFTCISEIETYAVFKLFSPFFVFFFSRTCVRLSFKYRRRIFLLSDALSKPKVREGEKKKYRAALVRLTR